MAEVRRLWLQSGVTVCGDSYFTREPGCIIQYRNAYSSAGQVYGQTNPDLVALREKDRIQGIEWKGEVNIGWESYRRYCVNWSDWMNDRPQICVSAIKRRGKWEIDTELHDEAYWRCGHHQGIFKRGQRNQKLDCDTIPKG